ncbi:hypothetical protein AOQ84DRAFT_220516, partial [Glonium stellatum]
MSSAASSSMTAAAASASVSALSVPTPAPALPPPSLPPSSTRKRARSPNPHILHHQTLRRPQWTHLHLRLVSAGPSLPPTTTSLTTTTTAKSGNPTAEADPPLDA